MVMTMVTANVDADKERELKKAYEELRDLPAFVKETFLLHEDGSGVWRIATVWNSRDDLDEYRKGVDTPAAIALFESVGALPTATIHDVAVHMTH